ncbi:hypothetical protein D9V29_14000 [Mycetocola manganoxydans]|uniref:DUF4365 domain-containing protein n=1 Tax=Mycetocola manganoxydans TaxID=699879 RepID=A0A3L6ZL07_9MICO|nr:hypothetical protein D9V29_14000 [Mycetocola manganoxydans]
MDLAHASNEIAADFPESRDWRGSPFEWILSVPSATKGSIGRRLVAEWAANSGFDVRSIRVDGQHYLDIDELRVQVKMSTLWSSGIYRFQQIRDRDYDYCLCLGLSPVDAHMWLLPKEALDIHVIGQLGQHTGIDSQETYWFDAGPGVVQSWLEPFGNDPAQVRDWLADAAGL